MDTKTENFTIIKLWSYKGAYNPSIENKRFLQPNKNPIPLMGCKPNLEDNNQRSSIDPNVIITQN